jgi:aconitate hydratase
MLAAGLVAKKAVEKGLTVRPYIKTTLSPGSGVVKEYFKIAGVQDALDKLGFTIAGYGCMTCIGNSGEIASEVQDAIIDNDLVAQQFCPETEILKEEFTHKLEQIISHLLHW